MKTQPTLVKLLLAFAAIYTIWGSTYLAIRFAIETLPPLLMASARFLVAGGLLYGFLRLRGEAKPTKKQTKNAAFVGALLLLGGNGGVVLAERSVNSGVVALLVAMVPLWMVLFEWLRSSTSAQEPSPARLALRSQAKPNTQTIIGLFVGFLGMLLLVGPLNLSGGQTHLGGVFLVMLGSMSWAAGSIYSRSADLPQNPFMATALEMLFGSLCLLIAGLLHGELSTFDPSLVSGRSLLAVLYLLSFGSLIGFTAYIWLLTVAPPAKVATYAYVNPVVAVLLGWLFAGEALTPRVMIAAAVIISAVVIITTGKSKKAQ